jgi:hypothetical protein
VREVASKHTGYFAGKGHLQAKEGPLLISAPCPTVQSCHFKVQLSSLEAKHKGREGEGRKKNASPECVSETQNAEMIMSAMNLSLRDL